MVIMREFATVGKCNLAIHRYGPGVTWNFTVLVVHSGSSRQDIVCNTSVACSRPGEYRQESKHVPADDRLWMALQSVALRPLKPHQSLPSPLADSLLAKCMRRWVDHAFN